ncbi:hypothetical protein D9615_003318 [Tricholomella constricta]|uniref:Uncharacterized protein n=1 Tax=Tricholomella constricta TaxID=117010 RepID=A0A8H5M7P1_9AGAR|nr:hypothetical protein D9615_003318 [Tricholomella constricta]
MQPLSMQLPPALEPVEPLRIRRRQPSFKHSQSLDSTLRGVKSAFLSSTTHISRRCLPVPSGLDSISGGSKNHASMPSTRPAIRPLPIIPSAPSPSSATSPSSRSPRPLPSPPSSIPLSASSSRSLDGEIATMTTPTMSSVPKTTEHPTPHHPSPSSSPSPPPALALPTPETEPSTLGSPLSLQPPTLAAQTAKCKRMAKLLRNLGEPIYDEAVYSHRRSSTAITTHVKGKILGEVERLGERLTYIRAAITVGRILDMASDEDEDEESIDEEEADAEAEAENSEEAKEDYSWDLEDGRTVFRGFSDRRHSRKWIHEKKGQRWEEPDYQVVLSALRAL